MFENDDLELEDEYSREKTLAVLTGLICMCVSLGGTVLGSYHAITTIGAFAGLLATACYIIADLVVYWAARIDYKEDGNAMEWSSWGVKYFLSFYLLFTGGCVAYLLFNDGGVQNNRDATVGRAKATFQDCVKSGAKQTICQKQYDSVMKSETELNGKVADTAKAEWLEKFLKFPLFNYIPGVLGLFGAVILTFVAKVIANKKRAKKRPLETPTQTNTKNRVTFLARNQIAPLQIASQPRHKVENGNGFALSLAAQGDGVSIRFQERGSPAKHVIRVTRAVAEKNNLETLNYTELAKWSLKALKDSGKESKPIYKKIEETL